MHRGKFGKPRGTQVQCSWLAVIIASKSIISLPAPPALHARDGGAYHDMCLPLYGVYIACIHRHIYIYMCVIISIHNYIQTDVSVLWHKKKYGTWACLIYGLMINIRFIGNTYPHFMVAWRTVVWKTRIDPFKWPMNWALPRGRRLRISELLVRYCGIFTPQIRVNASVSDLWTCDPAGRGHKQDRFRFKATAKSLKLNLDEIDEI